MDTPAIRLTKYSIPLVWSVWSKVTVEAASEEEAIKIALGPETPLPTDSYYVDDSVAVDENGSIEEYDEEELIINK